MSHLLKTILAGLTFVYFYIAIESVKFELIDVYISCTWKENFYMTQTDAIAGFSKISCIKIKNLIVEFSIIAKNRLLVQ